MISFDSLYKNLNKAQKEAVDTIEGPVMVIAGPGTGKTSILTLRIANILRQTDTAPENILALTFTESGAKAMRKKLVGIVGTRGYKVRIATFHGFCNSIIKEFPEKFSRIIGGASITDVDQLRLLEEIITKNSFEYIKPYGEPLYYIKPLLNTIKKLKREAISVTVFAQSVAKQEIDFKDIPDLYHAKGAHKGKMKGEYSDLQTKIEKNKEIITVYEAYEKALKKQKLYDYEDMIIETIKAFKEDADFLLQIQETYQYILADEHQDANNAQNTILELLSSFHSDPNLFIVGDEKQAIFRFQGASLENFLYFKNIYPQAKVIHLEDNYRSTQPILDAAHSLILHNKTNPTELASHAAEKALLTVVSCTSPLHEARYIAESIKRQSIPHEEQAVLYRDNKDAFLIASVFQKYGIPYVIESDEDLLHDPHIRKLVYLLRLAHDPGNEELLAKALFIDVLNIDALEVVQTIGQARKEKKTLLSLVKEKGILPRLSTWVSHAKNMPFERFLEEFVRESGFLTYAMAEAERFSVLTDFFDEVKNIIQSKREYYLADFIAHIDLIEAHGLLIKGGRKQKSGVRLMTAHRSKGLEFEHVYIVGVNDGHWGGRSKRNFFTIPILGEADTGIEDERRLFYVALTRAKKHVTITYHTENDAIPAQFIEEIDATLIIKDEKTYTDDAQFSFTVDSKPVRTVLDRELMKEKFLDQGLSVTALNNYIECSWRYFFVNLIRIPQAQSKHQMYGTAIHETLRMYFNHYREDKEPSKKETIEFFENMLHKQPLYEDFADTLEKGKTSLAEYFDQYKGTWPRNLFTEYSVECHIDVAGEEVLLKGNLDKVELIEGKKVNVVDYKTGKGSRNKENYDRQLHFYKLLLTLAGDYDMVSGELDFIEEKKRKKIAVESIDEIRATTVEVATEILSGKLKPGCGDCEFCELAKLL